MKAQAWNIFKSGKKIDTVFFDENLDKEYVLDSLVGHDGYDPNINIRKDNAINRKPRSKTISKDICKNYGIDPGRAIVCRDNNKELFSIRKGEGFSPTEADAMSRYIADNLNKKHDFKKYYLKYMGK